jgi:N-acetyl-gamma-glutamyl-phosphate reductase
MMQIRAGIIGGAGYTGGEMIRLLIRHPNADIRFIHSKSHAGKPVYSVHEDLIGDTTATFDADWNSDIDVIFLCVGHGEAKKFLDESGAALDGVLIIDLSQDYRLRVDRSGSSASGAGGERPGVNGHPFVYGLPELNREAIRGAHAVANPGCFATAIQLGLLPLAKAGLLGDVYTTGITGSTGAGQALSPTSHFSWRANNIQAYKTLTHQHLKEIGQSLQQVQAEGAAAVGVSGGAGASDRDRGGSSSAASCDVTKARKRSSLYMRIFTGATPSLS